MTSNSERSNPSLFPLVPSPSSRSKHPSPPLPSQLLLQRPLVPLPRQHLLHPRRMPRLPLPSPPKSPRSLLLISQRLPLLSPLRSPRLLLLISPRLLLLISPRLPLLSPLRSPRLLLLISPRPLELSRPPQPRSEEPLPLLRRMPSPLLLPRRPVSFKSLLLSQQLLLLLQRSRALLPRQHL